jgi:hypothetical protein
MSDIVNDEFETISAPEGQDQLEEVFEDVESLTEEQIDLLPVDEFGDKYVPITVDGEQLNVPLKEALAGYQRQADYTRKTQELGEQRRQMQFAAALQEALQNDPRATLDLLSQHYGVAQEPSEEEDPYADPAEKQYKELERRVQSFEQARAMEELDKTVRLLETKYGSDFDADAVIAKALAVGASDLEAVYKQMAFDKVYEEARAVREARGRRAQEQAKATEAKRQMPVTSGTPSVSADVSANPISSLRDAYEAAKRQLGV